MAFWLQRMHALPVVRVRLLYAPEGASVEVAAVTNEPGQQRVVGQTALSLAAFGYETRSALSQLPTGLRVPDEVIATLLAATADPESSWPGDDAREVWLHLVKPYGTLGAVPWERALVPALGRPVLRLPDVLPLPMERRSQRRIAVVVDAAVERRIDQLKMLLAAIDSAVDAQTALSVVVPGEYASALSDVATSRAPSSRPIEIFIPRESGGLTLARAAECLSGAPVDGVHFLLDGVSLGVEGALAPAGDGRGAPPPIATWREVQHFLMRVGAANAVFSAPHDSTDVIGLRLLADALGADHVGAVALHDSRPGIVADPAASLASLYRAMYSPSADALDVIDPAIMLFLQPAQLETKRDDSVEVSSTRLTRPGHRQRDILTYAAEGHFNPPPLLGPEPPAESSSWRSCAERYLEQKRGDVFRFEDEAEIRESTELERARFAGIRDAVDEATAVVTKVRS